MQFLKRSSLPFAACALLFFLVVLPASAAMRSPAAMFKNAKDGQAAETLPAENPICTIEASISKVQESNVADYLGLNLKINNVSTNEPAWQNVCNQAYGAQIENSQAMLRAADHRNTVHLGDAITAMVTFEKNDNTTGYFLYNVQISKKAANLPADNTTNNTKTNAGQDRNIQMIIAAADDYGNFGEMIFLTFTVIAIFALIGMTYGSGTKGKINKK